MAMEENGAVNPEVHAVVTDFIQYRLRQHGHNWPSSPSADDDSGQCITSKVGHAIRSLGDEFSSQYKENFIEMCEKLDISEVTLQPTIVGVANELFSEGIKWARIVAFFVFGSELALHCKDRNWPHLINIISHSVSLYITEKLLPWINDHGGWEGLVVFNESSDHDQTPQGRWPSMKNILCLGISALGALSLGALLTKSS